MTRGKIMALIEGSLWLALVLWLLWAAFALIGALSMGFVPFDELAPTGGLFLLLLGPPALLGALIYWIRSSGRSSARASTLVLFALYVPLGVVLLDLGYLMLTRW